MSLSAAAALPKGKPFRHEALFYAGEAEFVERTTSFIREGVDAGEPVLVAIPRPKVDLIRSALGPEAEAVLFGDMAEIGRNPARIIPLWREFVDGYSVGGRSVRGIGEPIWAARTPEELVESQRHEALLNLAFAGDPAWILCPYDTICVDPSILEEARKSHPLVSSGGASAQGSAASVQADEWAAPFDRPLAGTPAQAQAFPVETATLGEMRMLVLREALRTGLNGSKAEDLVIAVNEVATNTICHGGGRGTLKIWTESSSVVCEVTDEAGMHKRTKPLAGRERPKAGQEGGFGLWLVNQLCDLVQIRAFPTGSVVRLYMTLR